MSRPDVVDTYFMEHRAKLIDIAAFLDRLDRAPADQPNEDFRVDAFRRAIAILSDGDDHRAKRVLELFSDFTTELPQDAQGTKGALGAIDLTGDGKTGSA